MAKMNQRKNDDEGDREKERVETLERPEIYKIIKKKRSHLLVAQMVKNLSAMQETQVPSLGRDDPLEKGMATHSSILAWKIPWTEELRATVHGVAKSQTRLSDFTFTLAFSGKEKINKQINKA